MRNRTALFLLIVIITIAPARAEGPAQAVVGVGITVEDLDRSVDFFTRVLDFDQLSETEVHGKEYEQLTGVFGLRCRITTLRLGDERIELTEYLASRGRQIPRDSRSNDRWFQHIAIIVSDIDAAYARLRQHKVRHASTGPQTLPKWNRNAANIRAFYFHDPDGHVLEILQFPPGKGDPKWQRADKLFLGIDHTAIVVADTEKALTFYRDLLGMKVVGGSENYGDEQEHLNNVEGARLRITTLKAPAGPAVEFLEYLNPRDGRPYPADARPNDLLHWHTTIRVNDALAIVRAAQSLDLPVISRTAVDGRFLMRDTDGHAVRIEGR